MGNTKPLKWYQYKPLHSLGLTVFSVFLGKAIEKYGNVNMDIIKSLFQTFFIELWPIWFGIGVGLIYLATREIISIHKFLTGGMKFREQIKKQGEERSEFMTSYSNVLRGISRQIEEMSARMNEMSARMDKIEKINKKI